VANKIKSKLEVLKNYNGKETAAPITPTLQMIPSAAGIRLPILPTNPRFAIK
jgi:hypothetical protein